MFRFFQKPLAQFISVVRAPKSKEGYASIGGGSPLRQITDAQVKRKNKNNKCSNVPQLLFFGSLKAYFFTPIHSSNNVLVWEYYIQKA